MKKKMRRNGMSEADAGRKGGSAKVKKGFAKMKKARRQEIARRAAARRWKPAAKPA